MIVTLHQSTRRSILGDVLRSQIRVRIANSADGRWVMYLPVTDILSFRKALASAGDINPGAYTDFGSVMASRRLYRTDDNRLVTVSRTGGRYIKFNIDNPKELLLKLTALAHSAAFKRVLAAVGSTRVKLEETNSDRIKAAREERASDREKMNIRRSRARIVAR